MKVMETFKRQLDIEKLIQKKSYFLFGPRSTGKTFWLKKSLSKNIFYIDLLNQSTLLRLNESPDQLEQMIKFQKSKRIVIDEVQKLPQILDVVHRLIEETDYKFLLTGSSARKLKRENANMLGGRAGRVDFFSLSYSEVPNFNLKHYFNSGGLPRIYLSDNPNEELDAYVKTYLEQEVKMEANIRNLTPFMRFLKVATLSNGELINYSNISSDASVPASTVKEYFSILEDSLLGFTLEPWLESKKRKAIQTSKFYFFDPGVCRYIMGMELVEPNTNIWGRFFEQFILMELKSYISYCQIRKKIYFWRSTNKHEVDFIIEKNCAIEVKSKNKISPKDLNGLLALKEEKIIKQFYIISNDPIDRLDQGIQIIYWERFLKKLWMGEMF